MPPKTVADLLGAAKNAGLDVAGTGVGGTVGVKLGAILGSLILPGFGTVAGGIVGGYFGARHGRHFTSDIKQKAYREAAAVYQTNLEEFEQAAQGLDSEAAAEFQATKSSEQSRLMQHAEQTSQNIAQTKDALDSWIAYDNLVQPDVALTLLDAGLAEIGSLIFAIERRYRTLSWWRKFVWPDIEVLGQQEALTFLRRCAIQFQELRKGVEKGNAIDRRQVTSLLGRTGIMRRQIEAELTRINCVRRERDQQARDYIEAICTELLGERRKAEKALQATINSLKERIGDALRPLVTKLKYSSEQLKVEAGRLGITLPT